MKLDLYDGKYTVILEEKTSKMRALRYGEEWRDLTGDGLVLALLQHIQDLNEKIGNLEVANDHYRDLLG